MYPVLHVENLTKYYGKKAVVNNVSFSLYPGQIFGFVGPNGAGKSTAIKMITGLISISSGKAKIDGYNIEKAYEKAISKVGAVVEMPRFYEYMSGLDNLKLFSKFYGKQAEKRIPSIVSLVGLENRIREKVSTYSLGMKQRLGIAGALLNNPKLLILDEPTNGLDPNGIVEMRNILKALAKKENITIIVSSHNLAELEQTCDLIGLINTGKMIEYKTMAEIESLLESKQKVQLMCNLPHYASMILKQKFKIKAKVIGNSIILPIKESNIATIISFLSFKRVKIYGIKKIRKSLEELYFELLQSTRSSTSIA
ncbi:MAG: ABC transporter ATP-binding protein [Clostridiales bacterium]|nr:ABC transporter ATP-binding protein [Clostridiales bacterium]